MTENEAIELLSFCKPLGEKLAKTWYNIELDKDDRARLEAFRKLAENGWLLPQNKIFFRKAGLLRDELVLIAACSMWQSNFGRS